MLQQSGRDSRGEKVRFLAANSNQLTQLTPSVQLRVMDLSRWPDLCEMGAYESSEQLKKIQKFFFQNVS